MELDSIPADEQARIVAELSKRGAVWGLTTNGLARETLAVIEKLTREQQALVLASGDAVWG